MLWSDFDLEGRVKVPAGYYLVIGFLLKAYLIWIISLTHAADRSLLLSMFYTDHSSFYYAAIIGLPALFYVLLFSLKSQRQKPTYIRLWLAQYWLLTLVLLLDVLAQAKNIVKHAAQVPVEQMIIFMITVYISWFWLKSKRIKRFLQNWVNV